MNNFNPQYITSFSKSRSTKIGGSDISACLPHPLKSESLADYDRTALTVYQEKTGIIKRDFAGFQAEVGNFLEPLVLKRFIQEYTGDGTLGDIFMRGYLLCELDKKNDGYPNAESFQNTHFLHHTKAENEFAIAHADCISPEHRIIIEAKTAMSWATKRTENDPFTGYDFKLKGHQGIPLKHYYQVQYQSALYNLVYGFQPDKLYLALITDTNNFYFWEFVPVKKVQERLLEIASYMYKCIQKKQPPKELAMNQDDIKIMYPELDEDFRIISGDELSDAIQAAREAKEAEEQVKRWEQIKKDANNTLSIFLKDTKTLKGIVDGQIVDLATWQERKASERIIGLTEIKKDEELYKLVKDKNLIKESPATRFVKVKFKEDSK